MKTIHITLNGTTYPARLVMGALLLYKHETGNDITTLQSDDLEAGLMLLYCCAKCSSQAQGIDFPYDFQTFANTITPDDLTQWNQSIAEDSTKKKTKA